MDLQRVTQVFPASLDGGALANLDRCARLAHLPARFSQQPDLTGARGLLLDYLGIRSFRQAFVVEYATVIPHMLDAVNERARYDDLKQFDLSRFTAQFSLPAFAPA